MQKDMVPVEAAKDNQVEGRLAPKIAGQELASALIQDTVKYLGIQPMGISQLNGPYIQVRPAGEHATDILLVGSWRTHFQPGGDQSGPILDSLRPALPKPIPSAQLLAASPVAAGEEAQLQISPPYAPGRAVLAQTTSLNTPGAAAVAMAAASTRGPGVAKQLDTRPAGAPYQVPSSGIGGPKGADMMLLDRQQRMDYGRSEGAMRCYGEANGPRGGSDKVSAAPAEAADPRVCSQPIIEECLSDVEPASPRRQHRRHVGHWHRGSGDGDRHDDHHGHGHDHHHHHSHQGAQDVTQQVPGFLTAIDQKTDTDKPTAGQGGAAVTYATLTMQPAETVPDPDRVMEDVVTAGQPTSSQQLLQTQRSGAANAMGAEQPAGRPSGTMVPLKIPGNGNMAALCLQGPAQAAAGALGSPIAFTSAAVVPADVPGAGALILSPRPRSEWELDPAKITIERRLAVGGFGEVFLAKYEGTLVAVKRLLATDSDTTQRFIDEVHMLARLRHPNLLLFMGYTLTPEPSIVTEFMARGSLFHILRQAGNRPPDPRMQRAVAVAVARGMAYLHSRTPPILHLDLKSPNVLVDDRWRVKIADFGLSRVRQRTYISSGAAAGSPEWMAPEVLRCDHYAEAADVYSYGVVLWELLTGKAPWADLNAMQVVGAVGFARRSLPDPSEGDELLVQLCKACRAQDPIQRPSFAQIIEALDRHFSPAASAASVAVADAGAGGGGGLRRQLPALPAPGDANGVAGDGAAAAGTPVQATETDAVPASPVPAAAAGVGPIGLAAAASPFAAVANTRLTRRHSLAASAYVDAATVAPGGSGAAAASRGGAVSGGGVGSAVPRLDARFTSTHESPRSRRRYRSPRGEDMVGPPAVTARLQDGRKTPSPRTSNGRPWRGLLTSASSDEQEPLPRKPQPQPKAPVKPAEPALAVVESAAPGIGPGPQDGVGFSQGASPFAAMAAAEFGPESVADVRSLRDHKVASDKAAASPPTAGAAAGTGGASGNAGAAGAMPISNDTTAGPSDGPQAMEIGSPVASLSLQRLPLLLQQQQHPQTAAILLQESGPSMDVVLPLPPSHAIDLAGRVLQERAGLRSRSSGGGADTASVEADELQGSCLSPGPGRPQVAAPTHAHSQESRQGQPEEASCPTVPSTAAVSAGPAEARVDPRCDEQRVHGQAPDTAEQGRRTLDVESDVGPQPQEDNAQVVREEYPQHDKQQGQQQESHIDGQDQDQTTSQGPDPQGRPLQQQPPENGIRQDSYSSYDNSRQGMRQGGPPQSAPFLVGVPGNPVVARQIGMARFNGLRPGHRRVSSDEASRLLRLNAALASASAAGSASSAAPAAGQSAAAPGNAAPAGEAAGAGAGPMSPEAQMYTQGQPATAQYPQQQHRLLLNSASFGGGASGASGGGSSLLLPPVRRSRGLSRNSAPMRYTYSSGPPGSAGPGPHNYGVHGGGQFQSPPRARGAHPAASGLSLAVLHQPQGTGAFPGAEGQAAQLTTPVAGGGSGAVVGLDSPGLALGANMSLSPVSLDVVAAALRRPGAAGEGLDALGGLAEPLGMPPQTGGPGSGSGEQWPDTHSELSFAFILRDNVSVCSDDYLQSTSLDRLPLLEEDAMDAEEDEQCPRGPRGTIAEEETEDMEIVQLPEPSFGRAEQEVAGLSAKRFTGGGSGYSNHSDHCDDLEFELPRPFLYSEPEQPRQQAATSPPPMTARQGSAEAPSARGGVSADPAAPVAAATRTGSAGDEADLWAALQQHTSAARGSVSLAPTSKDAIVSGGSGDVRGSASSVTVPATVATAGAATVSLCAGCGGASGSHAGSLSVDACAASLQPQPAGPLRQESQPAPAGAGGGAVAIGSGSAAGGPPQPTDMGNRLPMRTSSGGTATTYRSGRFTVTIQPAAAEAQQAPPTPAAAAAPAQPVPDFRSSVDVLPHQEQQLPGGLLASQQPECPLQPCHSLPAAPGGPLPPAPLVAVAAAGPPEDDTDTHMACAAAAVAGGATPAPASPPLTARLAGPPADAVEGGSPCGGQQSTAPACPDAFRSASCNGFLNANENGANGGASSPAGAHNGSGSGLQGADAPGTSGRMRSSYNGYSSHSHSHHPGHPGELPPPLALNTVTMYRKGRFFVSSHAAGTHSLSVTNPLVTATGSAATSSHTAVPGGGSAGGGGGSGAESLHDESEEHDGGSGPTSPFASVAAVLAPFGRVPPGVSHVGGDAPAITPGRMSWAAVVAMPAPTAVVPAGVAPLPPRQESLGRQYSCGRFTVAESIVTAPQVELRRPSASSATAVATASGPGSGGGTWTDGDPARAAGVASAGTGCGLGHTQSMPQLHEHQPMPQAQPHLRFFLMPQPNVQPLPQHQPPPPPQQQQQQPHGASSPAAPMRLSLNGGSNGGDGAQPMWTSAPTSPRGEQVVVRKVGRFTVREVECGSNGSSRAPSMSGAPTPAEGLRRALDAPAATARLAVISGGAIGAAGPGSSGGGSGRATAPHSSPPEDAMVLSSHHSSCSIASASRTSSGSHGAADLDLLPKQNSHLQPPPSPKQQPQPPQDALLQPPPSGTGSAPQLIQHENEGVAAASAVPSPTGVTGAEPMQLSGGAAAGPPPQQQRPPAVQVVYPAAAMPAVLVAAAPAPAGRPAGAAPWLASEGADEQPLKVLRVKSKGRFTVIEHEVAPQAHGGNHQYQHQHRQAQQPGGHLHHDSAQLPPPQQQEQQGPAAALPVSGRPPAAPWGTGTGALAPAAVAVAAPANAPVAGRPLDGGDSSGVGGDGNSAQTGASVPAPRLTDVSPPNTDDQSGWQDAAAFAAGGVDNIRRLRGVVGPATDHSAAAPATALTAAQGFLSVPHGGELWPPQPGPQPSRAGITTPEGSAACVPASFSYGGAEQCGERPLTRPQDGGRMGLADCPAAAPWGLQAGPQDSEQAARFQADTARLVLERMERNAQQHQHQQPQGRQLATERHEEEGPGQAGRGNGGDEGGGGGPGARRCTYEVSFGDGGLTIQITHDVAVGGAGGGALEPGDGDEVMLDVGIVQGDSEDEEGDVGDDAAERDGGPEAGGAAPGEAEGVGEEEEEGEEEDNAEGGDWELRPLRPPETPGHEPAELERARRDVEGRGRAAAARRHRQRPRRLRLEDEDSDSELDSSSSDSDSMET